MAFKFNRSSKEPMSEINVTPFVDVMLVLLIIFMVTAPLLTVGVQVDLPESSADSLPEEIEPGLEATNYFSPAQSAYCNGCHVAERGYTGYRVGDGVWNFVHGNHYSASLTSNNEIESLVSRSFFKTSYKMQVSFNDSNKQELVVNNPDKKEAKLDFLYFDSEMNYLGKESIILNSLSTIIYNLAKYKFKYIEIKSNIIFCRPLVIKYYDTYFDVFHA